MGRSGAAATTWAKELPSFNFQGQKVVEGDVVGTTEAGKEELDAAVGQDNDDDTDDNGDCGGTEAAAWQTADGG
jgi:hypothetical protein